MNKLKYVRLPARVFDVVCDFRTTLFEPGGVGGVARVYLENPCLGRLASDFVGVFDGKLRLSLHKLAFEMCVCLFHVPNPAQANRSSPRGRYRTPLV